MNYLLDSHTHTIASGHAYSTLHEMARTAAQKGLSLLGITEHAPGMPNTTNAGYFSNMRILPRRMYGIEVMHGAEVNIMDYRGSLDLDTDLLKKMDVTVASLHIPCIKPGTREENTNAFLEVMKNPYINIIGHPDDSRYPIDYLALVQAAKEHGVLLELNNGSLNPLGARKDPVPNDVVLLRYCMQYQVPVILNSDAHTQEDVGNHCFSDILLEALHFPEELIVNRSVEIYKTYINRYRNS